MLNRSLWLALLFICTTTFAWAQQWLPGGTGLPIVCAYSSSPPTISSGGFVYAQCNNAGQLSIAGSLGGTTSNGSQLPVAANNLPVVSFLYLWNGTNFNQWSDSVVSGAANVAIVGCASGVCAPTSPANGVTNSVSVTSSGTSVQIAAARTGAIGTGRVSITVKNPAAAPGILYIGFGAAGTCPSVATLTGTSTGGGLDLDPGAAMTINNSGQICGAYAASSGYVRYLETY